LLRSPFEVETGAALGASWKKKSGLFRLGRTFTPC